MTTTPSTRADVRARQAVAIAADVCARPAVAVAREVVPGTIVDVSRDADNGKWEVTIRQDGSDYEVELSPWDLSLLRVDYD
jgi:uncharacterized membrane protein YkoI